LSNFCSSSSALLDHLLQLALQLLAAVLVLPLRGNAVEDFLVRRFERGQHAGHREHRRRSRELLWPFEWHFRGVQRAHGIDGGLRLQIIVTAGLVLRLEPSL
jgi:hypothetical protein